MPGPCTAMYGTVAKIAAPVMNGQVECPEEMADLFDEMTCKVGQAAAESARKKVDEKILCSLFCCCLATGGKQACVEEALTIADAETSHQARYKAEVSYNMQVSPPRPMMEKDASGNLTTQPVPRGNFGHLANRAEIEFDPGLRRPAGIKGYRYRRPDVIIVKDPNKPPTKSNISQVIEMKFPGDSLSPGQRADYERIGGKTKFKVYRKNSPCKCDRPKRRPVPEPVREPEPSVGGWLLLLGLGAAAIGLALLPVDGPAGEMAAGAAAAAQWGRMFAPAAAAAM